MRKATQKFTYVIISLLYIYVSLFPARTFATISGAKSEIRASIPFIGSIRIYGYTSPNSLVQATGVRTYAQAPSDTSGYFVMYDVPIAAQTAELCFTTIDSDHRTGFPICVPIPEGGLPGELGPILLSPTISISQGFVWQNQVAFASGKTIPNESVTISFFELNPHTLIGVVNKLLLPVVLADDLPLLTTTSDGNGNFSLTLPTSRAAGFRVFARASYRENPSPKSQTIAFEVGPILTYLGRYILPWLILFIIIVILIYIMMYYEKKNKKIRKFVGNNWQYFIEKRWKPFVVRLRLQLRRVWYWCRLWWKSHRR